MSRYDDDGGQAMPPSHAYEGAGQGSTEYPSNLHATDLASDDLKSILARISSQIAQVERRHGDALDAMAERLTHMGGQAQTAKARAPVQYAQAFERIEDSLADLATRIASASPPQTTEQAIPHGADQVVQAAAPGNPAPHLQPSADSEADVPDVVSAAAAVVHPPEVHPQHEPWDQEAADALTKLYYPDGYDTPDEELSPAEKVQFSLETERAWLDERFGNIAELVEQSVGTLRPDNAVAALSQQIEDLEHRMAAALAGIGKSDDGEALRLVEMQIAEVVTHLESTHNQLGRLEALEQDIGEIVERVSEQRLAEVMQRTAQPAPQQPAAAEIAELTAQRVADRMVQMAPPPPPPPPPAPAPAPEPRIPPAAAEQVDALHGKLDNFFAERREGDAHTAAALGAMHNVLDEVLARVHTLEMGAPPTRSPQAPQEYVREAVRFGNVEQQQQQSEVQPSAPEHPVEHPVQPETEVVPNFEGPSLGEPASEPAVVQPELAVDSDQQPTAVVSHDELTGREDPPMTGEAAPNNRDDFIAAARRAARKASAQAAQAAAAMEEAQEAMPAKKSFFSGDKRGPRPLVLVAAICALAIAGFSLLYGNLFGQKQSAPVAQRSSQKAPPMTKGLPAVVTRPQEKAGSGVVAKGEERRPVGKVVTQRPPAAPKQVNPKVPIAPEAPRTIPETMVERLAYKGEIVQPITQPELPRGVVLQPFPPQGREPVSPQRIIADKLPPGSVRIPVSKAAIRRGREAAPVRRSVPAAPVQLELPPADIGPLSLRLAAAKGDPSAEFEVAARYADGKGVERDYREAAAWYKRSAARGFAPSQYRLATLYERGIGVTKDLARARIWYKRAAEKGSVKAMHNLAVLSAGRSVGGPDYATAARWFQAAAERGLRDSQYNLGILRENGLGVSKSYTKAYQWFALATRAGDEGAKRQLAQLKKRMTKGQIATARKAVRTWRAKQVDRIVNDPFAAGQAWKHRAKAAR